MGIIPARYGSTRFPGKPLVEIAGKPLICHVIEACLKAKTLCNVIVATDDERVANVSAGLCRVEYTSSSHRSGTDRIAEVASRIECDAVINIQGDEPLLAPRVIDEVALGLDDYPISTAAALIRDPAEYDNPNVVKVVVNNNGQALYFSRRTIPYVRDAAEKDVLDQMSAFPFWKHVGIYGFRYGELMKFVGLPISLLEKAERLEQLRAIENGMRIGVRRVDYDGIGVDTPADVERVERILRH